MKNLFDIRNKTAIITGGSRGIGAMIARGFVENGVKTYITSRKASDCQATAKSLSEFGECIAITSDLSTVEGIEEFVKAFAEQEETLGILVNNAGATWGAPLAEFPESGWDKVVDLNLKSPFFLLQKLLPLLQKSGSAEDPARVINLASINGMTNSHMENYSYTAAKAGVIHLTRHLATQLAGDYINVNAISPGLFPSKMTAGIMSEQGEEILRGIPRGRAGTAEDAAGAAIFLSSRASAWITGVTLPVDGGVVASA